MFTASRLQIATYLLGVCAFFVAFLVYLNSSVSFVVTDLIHLQHGVGDAVGTLGFADELVALIACPFWGVLSDQVGVRTVCGLGYILVALALVVTVQCKNVYPQLLLSRLLFSFGTAAVSTMVTAILPAMSLNRGWKEPREQAAGTTRSTHTVDPESDVGGLPHGDDLLRTPSLSISSELTITPALYQSSAALTTDANTSTSPAATHSAATSSKIAGYVGMFAGFGALIGLVLFLPLPERFQQHEYSPEASLRYSYYIVAVVALIVSLWCLVGLRGLQGDDLKSMSIWKPFQNASSNTKEDGVTKKSKHVLTGFRTAVVLGFSRADICLGYASGFVARASSVGISLFVPLLVNALFHSSRLCWDQEDDIGGLPGIKKKCSQAYILAAELTGVSQVVALLTAPLFGYASARLSRRQEPLMFASAAGVTGYILLAARIRVDTDHQSGSSDAFFAMCLIGISQIGAIVCSLGILSGGILKQQAEKSEATVPSDAEQQATDNEQNFPPSEETRPLISNSQAEPSKDLSALKGSIAGVYSLYGGAGILLLTKLGGFLFDRVSFAAPFFIMAFFNAVLLVFCILVASKSLFRTEITG